MSELAEKLVDTIQYDETDDGLRDHILLMLEQYGREVREAAVIHLQNKISACDIDFPIGKAVAQSCVNEIRNLPLP